jgi:hypothetical protein
MKRSILTILFAAISAFASFESVIINPNAVRIGNISGFKPGDVLIPDMNYLASQISASYLMPFGLEDLAMQELSYSGRIGNVPYVIYASNFGNEDYRENTVGLSAGVYSVKDLLIYPALKLYNMKNELGNEVSAGIDMNAKYVLYEKLTAVMSVLNLYAYETDNVDIPMTICLNFEFRGVEYFNLYTGLEKDSRNKASFKTGLEYEPFEFFAVSAGYNFDPALITAGFSLKYKNFMFNYGMSYHFDLDYSHSLGIVYEF